MKRLTSIIALLLCTATTAFAQIIPSGDLATAPTRMTGVYATRTVAPTVDPVQVLTAATTVTINLDAQLGLVHLVIVDASNTPVYDVAVDTATDAQVLIDSSTLGQAGDFTLHASSASNAWDRTFVTL